MGDARELFEAIRAGDRDRLVAVLGRDPSLAAARDASGLSAVMTACYQMRRDLVGALREASPELDRFEAAALGETPRLQEILDERPEAAASWSPDGFTPLHLAAFFGRLEAARLLLRRGADPRPPARNPSRVTPLHSAAASRLAELVELLLDHGCDVDARQAGGFTALHSAAAHGDDRMVAALQARGADPSLASDEGRTAADLARAAGFEDLAARLSSPSQPSGAGTR